MHSRRFHLLGLFAVCCPPIARAQAITDIRLQAGKDAALLVVDAQVGVLSSVWEAKRVIANLQDLVAKARHAGVPVIWVQHADNELKHGSAAWKLAPGFLPLASELVIHKSFNSSFANTDLDARLKAMRVSRVILAGAATNWCIRATAYAAVDRGYHLTLVGDAHSTEPLQLAGGTVVPAESIVNELNAVFEWLSAPNVRTEVRSTANVTFH